MSFENANLSNSIGEERRGEAESGLAIRVSNLSKCYQIYETPQDRLKQSIYPRLQRLAGQPPRQYFREFWALKDVSFEIKKGETVGIIGRNGSGKSTLLQMVCGTLNPTSGNVQANGRIAALLELGAGFNPEFTGRENIFLNAAILGFPREAMAERMQQVLDFSELGGFIDQPVRTYSSGMYARLAFATAIHVDPQILVIDETLAVGDARFVAKCMRRIHDIKERGTSILFVSHDVGSVRSLCERAIWIDKALMVADGDVFPVTGRYMAYMFRDEQSPEQIVCDELIQQATSSQLDLGDSPSSGSGPAAIPVGKEPKERRVAGAEKTLDARPVAHWGARKGMILSASVCDQNGLRQDVHAWGGQMEVLISVHVPGDISREHLSVAFSIKDLKGTDLIVSTTHDFLPRPLPDAETFQVSFRLTNRLTTGKYVLVVAVESRQQNDIYYYEYIEGAHYFSSLADARLFGQFHPKIEQRIRCHSELDR